MVSSDLRCSLFFLSLLSQKAATPRLELKTQKVTASCNASTTDRWFMWLLQKSHGRWAGRRSILSQKRRLTAKEFVHSVDRGCDVMSKAGRKGVTGLKRARVRS